MRYFIVIVVLIILWGITRKRGAVTVKHFDENGQLQRFSTRESFAQILSRFNNFPNAYLVDQGTGKRVNYGRPSTVWVCDRVVHAHYVKESNDTDTMHLKTIYFFSDWFKIKHFSAFVELDVVYIRSEVLYKRYDEDALLKDVLSKDAEIVNYASNVQMRVGDKMIGVPRVKLSSNQLYYSISESRQFPQDVEISTSSDFPVSPFDSNISVQLHIDQDIYYYDAEVIERKYSYRVDVLKKEDIDPRHISEIRKQLNQFSGELQFYCMHAKTYVVGKPVVEVYVRNDVLYQVFPLIAGFHTLKDLMKLLKLTTLHHIRESDSVGMQTVSKDRLNDRLSEFKFPIRILENRTILVQDVDLNVPEDGKMLNMRVYALLEEKENHKLEIFAKRGELLNRDHRIINLHEQTITFSKCDGKKVDIEDFTKYGSTDTVFVDTDLLRSDRDGILIAHIGGDEFRVNIVGNVPVFVWNYVKMANFRRFRFVPMAEKRVILYETSEFEEKTLLINVHDTVEYVKKYICNINQVKDGESRLFINKYECLPSLMGVKLLTVMNVDDKCTVAKYRFSITFDGVPGFLVRFTNSVDQLREAVKRFFDNDKFEIQTPSYITSNNIAVAVKCNDADLLKSVSEFGKNLKWRREYYIEDYNKPLLHYMLKYDEVSQELTRIDHDYYVWIAKPGSPHFQFNTRVDSSYFKEDQTFVDDGSQPSHGSFVRKGTKLLIVSLGTENQKCILSFMDDHGPEFIRRCVCAALSLHPSHVNATIELKQRITNVELHLTQSFPFNTDFAAKSVSVSYY